MNYQKITPISIADGLGCRVVLWVSGCEHHCIGCHNPETHDPASGYLFDKAAEEKLFELLRPSYIAGITFSGGDPLYSSNIDTVTRLAKQIRNRMPEKDIWVYTGYLYEEVRHLELLQYIDVLVDGEYEQDKRCVDRFYGSTNQRMIFLKTLRKIYISCSEKKGE